MWDRKTFKWPSWKNKETKKKSGELRNTEKRWRPDRTNKVDDCRFISLVEKKLPATLKKLWGRWTEKLSTTERHFHEYKWRVCNKVPTAASIPEEEAQTSSAPEQSVSSDGVIWTCMDLFLKRFFKKVLCAQMSVHNFSSADRVNYKSPISTFSHWPPVTINF